jgi:hypothetical protein
MSYSSLNCSSCSQAVKGIEANYFCFYSLRVVFDIVIFPLFTTCSSRSWMLNCLITGNSSSFWACFLLLSETGLTWLYLGWLPIFKFSWGYFYSGAWMVWIWMDNRFCRILSSGCCSKRYDIIFDIDLCRLLSIIYMLIGVYASCFYSAGIDN